MDNTTELSRIFCLFVRTYIYTDKLSDDEMLVQVNGPSSYTEGLSLP